MLSPARCLAAILMTSTMPALPVASPPSYDAYAGLLARYVTTAGVQYDAWRQIPADVTILVAVVAGLEEVDTSTLTRLDRLALYINLYNAKVLELVVLGNPARSIRNLSRWFNPYDIFMRKELHLDGERLSLMALESRLREESQDPRVHFAVNCASRSCPPIATEPYRGASLDAQLDRSTRAFLASDGAIIVTGRRTRVGRHGVRISVSKIFSWYAKDFATVGGSLAFVLAYAPPDVAARIRDAGQAARLVHQDYDWSLNAAPGAAR